MPNLDLILENRDLKMSGDYKAEDVFLKGACVKEGLSQLTETTIEFIAKDKKLELKDMVGYSVTVSIKDANNKDRKFIGYCISAEYIGLYQGYGHFIAEVRPWLWFMTQTTDSRIFQDKSTLDIIKDLLGEYGFSSDLDDKTTATYEKRTYCVQYRETDYAFLCRLMEEDGIYFYFNHDGTTEKLVLADSISAHKPTPGGPTFEFKFREKEYRRKEDHIFDWNAVERLTPGKVTINDYDFETPNADQKKVKIIEKGAHSHKGFERYDYPGHNRPSKGGDSVDTAWKGAGERLVKVRMEAEAAAHQRWRGAGNVRTMGAGQTFKLKDHPRVSDAKEFLLVSAMHHLQIETDYEDEETRNQLIDSRLEYDPLNKDTYRCIFEVIPKADQFRAPLVTPWPQIPSLHTAIVTGPSGEEIHTDKYGRIKVQFHWDREGKKNETSTCWIRTVMPWTGKNWGMIAIPRIGQEVVIQFEEGDPDRPICTGMLYNADTMPPYELDKNKTQSGVKTRSTMKGGAENFNELMFEDKKGEELVRFVAEKDYKQVVENNADITIGLEKKDEGSLTQTIHKTKTETIKTGDHIFKVEKGNQDIFVKTDHKEVIEGKADQTITGNTTQTIKQGNLTRKVEMGNEKVTVSMGNYSLKTALGKIDEEAMQSIELKVGASSIKIEPAQITITAPMIKIEGKAMLKATAPMTDVSGSGMLILKGGLVKIN